MNQKQNKQPIIYEINTAVFLREQSDRYGETVTFATVPDEVWDEIASKGITMVWFMGVWQRSDVATSMAKGQSWVYDALPDATDADVVGSAYSIADYTVDDRFGGDQGLAMARQKLRERGIQLMLDYVPNHVAIDHPWVGEHPEYFLVGTEKEYSDQPGHFVQAEQNIFANAKDPNFPPWSDVLQLNAFSSELREAAQLIVMKIASQCDAVRCDMAMLLLNDVFKQTWRDRVGEPQHEEFWDLMIKAVKSVHPEFVFIAEVYWKKETILLEQGFDFCYDKELYDALIEGTASNLASHLHKTRVMQYNLLRFIENHDEERAAYTMPLDRHKAAAVIIATLPGASMYHDGQFEGFRSRVPVQLARRRIEPRDDQIAKFYTELLSVEQGIRGEWQQYRIRSGIFSKGHGNLLGWCWSDDTETLLVITNFGSTRTHGHITLPFMTVGKNVQTVFGAIDFQMRDHTLRIQVSPWAYAIIKISDK